MICSDYIAAGSETVRPGDLELLSRSEFENVRRRVAENEKAPQRILAALSKDECVDIRIAVGLNRATSADVLNCLVMDESVDLRYALAETHYLPLGILQILTEDENSYVRMRAMRTISAFNRSVIRFNPKSAYVRAIG
jgi:hypothetical protein